MKNLVKNKLIFRDNFSLTLILSDIYLIRELVYIKFNFYIVKATLINYLEYFKFLNEALTMLIKVYS
jgi:hypothetical protein